MTDRPPPNTSSPNPAEPDMALPPTPRLRTIRLPSVSPSPPPLSPTTRTDTPDSETRSLEPSRSPLSTSSSQQVTTSVRFRLPFPQGALPVEVTNMILLSLASSESSSSGFRSGSMLPLRSVCKDLRNAIDGNAHFWRIIPYDDHHVETYTRSLQHAILSLHRPNTNLPFNKWLFIRATNLEPFTDVGNSLATAVNLIPFCLHVGITLPHTPTSFIEYTSISDHQGGQVTVATLLSTLCVHPDIRSFAWKWANPITSPLPSRLLPSSAPESNTRESRPHQWQCLTSLKLGCPLSLEVCVGALESFRDTLESVTFDSITSGEDITAPPHPFSLPSLLKMKVTIGMTSADLTPLFTGVVFQAPALQSFELNTPPGLELLYGVDQLPKWNSLSKLTLNNVSLTDGLKLLHAYPSLTVLHWRTCDATPGGWATRYDLDQAGIYLPKLKEMILPSGANSGA